MQATQEEIEIILNADSRFVQVKGRAVTLNITVRNDNYLIKAETNFIVIDSKLTGYFSYDNEKDLKHAMEVTYEREVSQDEFDKMITHLKEMDRQCL